MALAFIARTEAHHAVRFGTNLNPLVVLRLNPLIKMLRQPFLFLLSQLDLLMRPALLVAELNDILALKRDITERKLFGIGATEDVITGLHQ